MPRTMTEIRTTLAAVLEDLAEHEDRAAKLGMENTLHLTRRARRHVAVALGTAVELADGLKKWGAA